MKRLWLPIFFAAMLPAQVRLPDYQHRVLPNGVVLDLLPKKDVPMVVVRAVLKGGAEADPADKAGLSYLTAELLRRGAAGRTADQFAEQLDFIGANFQATVDAQSTQVSIEFLNKDAARALDLFSTALLKPSFTADEVKKALEQSIDAARGLKDEPGPANAAYYRAFFYPPRHPYHSPVQGDELSLARITRDDVVRHHARQYAGRNLTLIAVGDFDASLGDKLAQTFGALPAGELHSWVKNPPALARQEARLLLIDKPDATQTYFIIGQPGIDYASPDRAVLQIVNTLFGGRFTSMLNDELRTNTGLTYGVRSQVERNHLPGSILISSFTRTDTTVRALDVALEVVNRLRTQGITAEQLASAKAYIKGLYPTDRLETNDQLAATLAELEVQGMNRGEIDDYFSRLDAVTLEQANAAARRYIRADNLQFCLLGKASAIRDQVKKYAPKMQVIEISQPGFPVPQF